MVDVVKVNVHDLIWTSDDQGDQTQEEGDLRREGREKGVRGRWSRRKRKESKKDTEISTAVKRQFVLYNS